MHTYSRLLLAAVVLLIAGAAWAQEQGQGWLGAQLEDVTKEEADKLGWEAPRGAKVVGLRPGSPAATVGLEPGDVISTLDGVELQDITGFTRTLIAKGAGTSVRLRLIRAGKERTVAVTLGEPPGRAVAGVPQLMLDTGGHMAVVTGVAFTPDGNQIVSGSQDKVIRVWDIDTGKTIRFIRGEVGPGRWGAISTLGLSPDGRWLAVGGYLHEVDKDIGGAVRLYDFASGRLETMLKGHDKGVLALAFSPDGKRLVSGSRDKTAIVWDLTTRQQLHRLSGHSEEVKAVAFTSDRERVVTGSSDGTLRLWRAADGKPIAVMTEHKQAQQRTASEANRPPNRAGVTSIATSVAESLIASGSQDGRILLWDGRTGAYLRELVHLGGWLGWSEIGSISLSADGRWLLSSHIFLGCTIIEVASGLFLVDGKRRGNAPEIGNNLEHIQCTTQTAFALDGRLAAAGYNSIIRVLDAQSPKLIKSLESTATAVRAVDFTDAGRSIVWGYEADKFSRRVRLPSGDTPLGQVEKIEIRHWRESPPG